MRNPSKDEGRNETAINRERERERERKAKIEAERET